MPSPTTVHTTTSSIDLILHLVINFVQYLMLDIIFDHHILDQALVLYLDPVFSFILDRVLDLVLVLVLYDLVVDHAGNAVLVIQVVVVVVGAINTAGLDVDSCNLVTRLEGLEILFLPLKLGWRRRTLHSCIICNIRRLP